MDGCSTTLRVFVESGVAADTNLVAGLINTSPEDFVRFLLRPKGARTDRHGIRSMKRNVSAADDEAIPDTAKLAADTIHEVTGWHVPSWGELGDALFEIARPIERGAFYLLLANVTEDFAFDWYSGILLSPASKCDIGRFAYGCFRAPETSMPFQIVGPAFPIFPPNQVYLDAQGIHLGEGTWCVIVSVEVEHPDFPQSPGQSFAHLVVDVVAQTPCGPTIKIDVPADADSKVHKFVRKVNGPDWIGLKVSYHAENPLTFRGDIVAIVEGFRI